MSKWKTALHVVKRTFMCCIRCTDIVDRMTRTATEELEANQTARPNDDRKSSIAKIVITNGQNEEHIEFTQPISIRYMGDVHIHNESHYYTPDNRTPIRTPSFTPNNSNVDLRKYVELALKDSPRSQMFKRAQRLSAPQLQGYAIRETLREGNPDLNSTMIMYK